MTQKLDSLSSESKDITKCEITCSDASQCFVLKNIDKDTYDSNRLVREYCSKGGLGCSEKVLKIREDLGINVGNLY